MIAVDTVVATMASTRTSEEWAKLLDVEWKTIDGRSAAAQSCSENKAASSSMAVSLTGRPRHALSVMRFDFSRSVSN